MDRWKLLQWNADEVAAKLKKTGLNISCSAESKPNSTYIEENIDFPFAGKTVTFSAIISEINKNSNILSLFLRANNTLLHSCPIKSTGLVSTTYTFANDFNGIVGFEIGQGGSEGGFGSCDFTLLAVKVELGSAQTLAHKEGDKWVLNEIPDFGEQLRRCQRYFQRHHIDTDTFLPAVMYQGELDRAHFNIPLHGKMRTKPTARFDGSGRYVTAAFSQFRNTSIHLDSMGTTEDLAAITVIFNGISAATSGWVDSIGDIDFSADL